MGTKFTTPIISGYDSNPPPDDGSQVTANLMTWAGVKTKLADSIKNWVDSINTALTDHFDEGPINKVDVYTTTDADYGKVIECDGTFTITAKAPSTAGAGYRVSFKNVGSGTVTVAAEGGATIDGETSVGLEANGMLDIIADSSATKYLRRSYLDVDADAGWYRHTDGSLRANVGGTEAYRVGLTNSESVLPLLTPGGSVSAAGLAVGETDQGLYEITTDTLGLTAGGTLAAGFDSAGVYVPAGTAGAPGLSISGDRDTGLYRVGGNTLGVSAAGAVVAKFDAGGLRTVDGSAADPPYAFDNNDDTGMFRSSSNVLGFAAAGTEALRLASTWVRPLVPLYFPDGTEGAPAMSFFSDQDTGWFLDDGMKLSLDGSWCMRHKRTALSFNRLWIPNMNSDEQGEVMIGLNKDGTSGYDSVMVMASRQGLGTGSSPNGFYIVGGNQAGTGLDFDNALRYATGLAGTPMWYIGSVLVDTENEIMTKAAVDALIAQHVVDEH